MNSITRYILILCTLFTGLTAFPQFQNWRNYTITDHATSFIVDHSDMWVCTPGGLVNINLESGEKKVYNHTNSPSIQSYFKISNDNPDYFFTKKEKNNYFLDFFTDRGTKRTIQLGEVWGFCDGTGVFIENEGKPYQLRYLGAISILRYEKTYHKNQTSQLLTLLATGNTVTEIKEGINAFYVIEEDLILPYKEEYLKNILSKNPTLYQEYMKESKKKRWSRRLFYISEYNRIRPLNIEETGIEIN